MSDERRGEIDQRQEVCRLVLRRDGECVLKTLVPRIRCWGHHDAHEPETRARFPGRKAWLDPDRCVLLCQGHHRWVTADLDREATALGLSIHDGVDVPVFSARAWRERYLRLTPRVSTVRPDQEASRG